MTHSDTPVRNTSLSFGEGRGEVGYLIIGQGISGTLLSYYLQQQGASILVVDDGNPSSASRVASGVINPVTGKRLVQTWMIDQLLPHAQHTYGMLGELLNSTIYKPCSILDFPLTSEHATTFAERQQAESRYLQNRANTTSLAEYFRFNYGVGQVHPALLVDINTLLTEWRKRLAATRSLLQDRFSWSDCTVTPDYVTYKNITAQKIILCDGAVCEDDPYFRMLPWSKDKGEALIVSIPGLPADNIYKQGISIVPWRDDLFWVGATHDWKFTDMTPTAAFRKQTEEHLDYWLKLPYIVVDHIVAQRPTNLDRKPFVGIHPLHPNIGIFNGMGTKGCSVAPYFALQFAQHLTKGTTLESAVDVKRFTKILSR